MGFFHCFPTHFKANFYLAQAEPDWCGEGNPDSVCPSKEHTCLLSYPRKKRCFLHPWGHGSNPMNLTTTKNLAFSLCFFFFSQIKEDGLVSNHGVSWRRTQALQPCPHCPIVAEPASLIRLGLCWLLGWREGLGDAGRLPGNFLRDRPP